MTEAQIVDLIVAGLRVLPALAESILSVLRPDVSATVRQRLDAAHARLDAMTSPRADVDTVIARHSADAGGAAHLERIARSLAVPLTADERVALSNAVELMRAVESGHLVSAIPPVLDVPANPFVEPSHKDD